MLLPDRRSLTPLLLCVPLALLAGLAGYCAGMLGPVLLAAMPHDDAAAKAFADAGIPGLVGFASGVLWAFAAVLAGGSVLGLFRRRWTLGLIRKCYVAVYILFVGYVYMVLQVTGAFADAALAVDGAKPDLVGLFKLRMAYLGPAAAAVATFALLHAISLRAATIGLYAPPAPAERTVGDRAIENLRTHGRSPRYRKSLLSSVTVHVMIILVLPWLWALRGCIDPYLVPLGSGTPAVARVQFVQRKRKKKKRFILRPNSKIEFSWPDLDDSTIQRQVDLDSQLTYTAVPGSVHGKMGAGGGNKGGWPEGVAGGALRFIRIKHSGGDWDDGMDNASRADQNFLNFIRKEVPFRVARTGEAHAIRLLTKYPPGRAPPFVYLTGDGRISGVSASDREILRKYCLSGGMLFADAGSARFDRYFRQWISQVFGKRLVVIADDDPLFQMPYVFPNGPPPLWHHGGRRALGIKHRGRWCVFYHPGDLNDAWKTGHSGLRPKLAKAAYQTGVNVIYYAVTNYLEMTRKQRK